MTLLEVVGVVAVVLGSALVLWTVRTLDRAGPRGVPSARLRAGERDHRRAA